MESLGFVVLNYNTWEETIKCVESIISTFHGKKKIMVVDNASTNNSYTKLCDTFKDNRYSDVECILSDKNGGFAYGNNIGIRKCKALNIKYAIVTNNDVVFLERTIEGLLDDIKRNENTVQIAPRILNPDMQTISMPWKSRQSLSQFLGLRSASKIIYKENEINGLKKVYMVSGCCFIIDVDKFINMGAIDDGTFLYMEEGTISMSALKYGYDVMYDQSLSVIHNHGQSTGRKGLFVEGELIKSSLYYWRKYERANRIELILIYMCMSMKTLLKIFCRRIDKKGIYNWLKETTLKLINEMKQARGV